MCLIAKSVAVAKMYIYNILWCLMICFLYVFPSFNSIENKTVETAGVCVYVKCVTCIFVCESLIITNFFLLPISF